MLIAVRSIERRINSTAPEITTSSDTIPQKALNLFHQLLDDNASHEIPWHLDHKYFGPDVLVYTFRENRPLMCRKMKFIEGSCDGGSPLTISMAEVMR